LASSHDANTASMEDTNRRGCTVSQGLRPEWEPEVAQWCPTERAVVGMHIRSELVLPLHEGRRPAVASPFMSFPRDINLIAGTLDGLIFSKRPLSSYSLA
jgi:hypothetical protein